MLDSVILNAYSDVLRRKEIIRSKSKFKVGQFIKVSDDIGELREYYLRMGEFLIGAIMKAKYIAGEVMTVLDIDELVDENGVKGLYVTLESDGLLHLLPERLLNEVGEEK